MQSQYAKRKDANHDEIKQACIDAGWQWEDTYQYGGVLLDGIVNRDGITVLVECKALRGRLTERESKVFDTWRGETVLAFSPSQAVAQLADVSAKYIKVEQPIDEIPF